MGKKVELVGKVFGKLTVLSEGGRTKHGKVLWECLCECGNTKSFISGNLVSGLSETCGQCANTPDLIGKTFGDVTVIRKVGLRKTSSTKNSMFWECVDSRGYKKEMRTADFTRNSRTKLTLPKEDSDIVIRRVFSKYKHDSKKKSREFLLSFDEFKSLVCGDCFYCGTPPKNMRKSNSGHKDYPLNGIDRVDSSRGYTSDNVKSCCYICNRAKSNIDIKDFEDYLNNLVEYRSKL